MIPQLTPDQWLESLDKAEQLGLFSRPAKPKPKPKPKPKAEAKPAPKGGPYIGPKGGKWADPKHTIPWKDPTPAKAPAAPEAPKKPAVKPGAPIEIRRTQQGWVAVQGARIVHRGSEAEVRRFAEGKQPAAKPAAAPKTPAAPAKKIVVPGKTTAELDKERIAAAKMITVGEGRYTGEVAWLSAKTSPEAVQAHAERMTPKQKNPDWRTPLETPATAMGPDGQWYAGSRAHIQKLCEGVAILPVGYVFDLGSKPGWHGETAGWDAAEELMRVKGYFAQQAKPLAVPEKPIKTARGLEKELAKHGFDVANGRASKRGNSAHVSIYRTAMKDDHEELGKAQAAAEQLWPGMQVHVGLSRDEPPPEREAGQLEWPPPTMRRAQGYSPVGANKGVRYDETKNLSTGDIAKRLRQDIAEAKTLGYLPKQFKASVTTEYYSMGSSITIEVKDLPADFPIWRERGIGGVEHPTQAQTLLRNLEMLGNMYNHQDIDSQTDYFNVRYHQHVRFNSDLSEFHRLMATDLAKGRAYKMGVEVLNAKKPDISVVGDALVGLQGCGLSKDYPYLERKVQKLYDKLWAAKKQEKPWRKSSGASE